MPSALHGVRLRCRRSISGCVPWWWRTSTWRCGQTCRHDQHLSNAAQGFDARVNAAHVVVRMAGCYGLRAAVQGTGKRKTVVVGSVV